MAIMAALSAAPLAASRPPAASRSNDWFFYFLERLDEFAKLAWYLVADSRLVESVVLRSLTQLDRIPFDSSAPDLTYNQARDILIAEAIAILDLENARPADEFIFMEQQSVFSLPDLPRLAFVLKLVLRSSETEVAKLLKMSPAMVAELVQDAIVRLGQRLPPSAMLDFHDA